MVDKDLGLLSHETSMSIADKYRTLYSIDQETLRVLSHSKRFLERWIGDVDFKNSIIDGNLSLKDAQDSCRCGIDVHTLLPVFHPDYRLFRSAATSHDWPLTYLWDQHIANHLKIRDSIASYGGSQGITPEFDLWRMRNMGRAAFQLDAAASGITHPPVAFELSSGCSVGCWFCGVSAKKFAGHATLADGGDVEWRKTLEAVKAIIGSGMQCGFCYWATDPLDNPEYVGFLEIFEDVVGVIPQTTTAIPLRNVDLTKSVLAEWDKRKSTPNRFSVMTKRQLLEIHERFTPEELFGVEIVLQMATEGAITKFAAGRNVPGTAKKEASLEGTIACVTGFLINVVERTVKLISPTMPSDKWPDGYIIYSERDYRDAVDLADVLKDMTDNCMQTNLVGSKAVQISDGGHYDPNVRSDAVRFRRIEISNAFIERVGADLSAGMSTPLSIARKCIGDGMDPIQVIGEMEKLWSEGVITQAL